MSLRFLTAGKTRFACFGFPELTVGIISISLVLVGFLVGVNSASAELSSLSFVSVFILARIISVVVTVQIGVLSVSSSGDAALSSQHA